MLTSVSFIVINSIRAVSFQNKFIKVDNESCSDKCSSPASYMQNAAPLDLVSSGLISELVKCLDFKPMRFHCRVSCILSSFLPYMIIFFSISFSQSCLWAVEAYSSV